MGNPCIPDTANYWTGSLSPHTPVSHKDMEYDPTGCHGDCARLKMGFAFDGPHLVFEGHNTTHKDAGLTSCSYCIQ